MVFVSVKKIVSVFFICMWIPVSLFAENKMVPKSIVLLDDEYKSLIFVEKELQQLHLYEMKNGEISKRSTFSCSTGEIKGRKQLDGDKKTPDGVYFFQKKYIDKYLAPIYGTGAFTTDYPLLFRPVNESHFPGQNYRGSMNF